MFTEKPNTSELFRRLILFLPAIALMVGERAWAQSIPENYEMMVYQDTRQGAHLAAGQYQEAAAVNPKRNPTTFDRFNNQCVVLTVTKAFDLALEVCDQAVEAADLEASPIGGQSFTRVAQKRMSMAMTNRGVLRAVTGDSMGARQDFEAVIALDSDADAATANLLRLSATANDFAATDPVQ